MNTQDDARLDAALGELTGAEPTLPAGFRPAVMDEVKKRGYSVVDEQTSEQQVVTVKVRRFA